jgi:hypothetical protein
VLRKSKRAKLAVAVYRKVVKELSIMLQLCALAITARQSRFFTKSGIVRIMVRYIFD